MYTYIIGCSLPFHPTAFIKVINITLVNSIYTLYSTYLFFISLTSLLRVTTTSGPSWPDKAGEEAITIPGVMLLVLAVRIW